VKFKHVGSAPIQRFTESERKVSAVTAVFMRENRDAERFCPGDGVVRGAVINAENLIEVF
jgi:hypothetical protein